MKRNTTPSTTLDAMLDALIDRKVEEKLEARLADLQRSPRLYHQDARHPLLDSRVLHLRAHRALRHEGHPGATSRGKHRLLTEAAIREWVARSQMPKATSSAPRSIDDEVLRELGGRRRDVSLARAQRGER